MGYLTFVLIDRSNVLEPEDHRTLDDAVARANDPTWRNRPWVIVDPAGRYAATPATHTTTHGENP